MSTLQPISCFYPLFLNRKTGRFTDTVIQSTYYLRRRSIFINFIHETFVILRLNPTFRLWNRKIRRSYLNAFHQKRDTFLSIPQT